MADEISDIRFFVTLVAAGNLSAAARTLESSPAVMSRRLTALENRLGVRLATRTSRRFDLTEEGAHFHERCSRIVREIEEAEAEAAEGHANPRGHLRIGAPIQWGRRILAPLVARFNERYRAIEVHLVLTDGALDVVSDGLDLVLGVHRPSGTEAVVKTLLTSRRVVCAAPPYLARYGTPQTPDDLKDHDCIRLEVNNRTMDRWLFKDGDGTRTVQVAGKLTTNSTEVVYDWVLAGRGLALRAEWDIADDLRSRRLVACLSPFWCDVIHLYAVYASRRHLSPRIRAFLDFIDVENEEERSVD